ncbi:MAG: hypothetical protein AAF840_02640, partial [Bacteroidota bacterium]
MPDLPPPLQALLADPEKHLAGTDVKLEVPIGQALLDAALDARPEDVPIDELRLFPQTDNVFYVLLVVQAPFLGSVRRELEIRSRGVMAFPDQPWLQFDIT